MSSFDDVFAGLFGAGYRQPAAPKPEARPIPQIRGFKENGVFYVRADDIADAMESQAPAVCRRLIDKLRSAAG